MVFSPGVRAREDLVPWAGALLHHSLPELGMNNSVIAHCCGSVVVVGCRSSWLFEVVVLLSIMIIIDWLLSLSIMIIVGWLLLLIVSWRFDSRFDVVVR